ncbi:hypothetical protein KHD59_002395, partial [Sesame phyllody phytoplasma]|nr:hypothetical protein [Sesame phyllody phytoplasma]
LSKENNFYDNYSKKKDNKSIAFSIVIKYVYNERDKDFTKCAFYYYNKEGQLIKKKYFNDNIFYTYHYNKKNQLEYRGAKEA